jgi:ribosomal protein S18 acetylase RimI-like enzyme/glycosyltransferase involved in cell wall biosynthesis
MKQAFKRWIFALLGKQPEAVIVCFRTGERSLADAMCREIRELEPNRTVIEVQPEEPEAEIRKRLRPYRIGLAPVLFTGEAKFDALRRLAFRLAPGRVLAYNGRLERHHLKLTQPIASWLFRRGIPLDRIFLRPRWLAPLRKDKTRRPTGHRQVEGRAPREGRKKIAVLTPYFPYPLSHGGAVRMFNLLRETAREFDVVLYAFREGPVTDADLHPVLEFVTRVYLVEKPRYREPRWSTLLPPEVGEYASPEMTGLLAKRDADLLQVEYTYLAQYGGDILVEHDVTFDLYAQILERARQDGQRVRSARWDWWRWKHFESQAVRNYRRVVVMSDKDVQLLAPFRPQCADAGLRVIENGVDLARFVPQPETPGTDGRHILFIGSFRHFPNIVAFGYLTEQVLPRVRDYRLTVVAGPEPWLHWRNFTGTLPPEADERVRLLEFVADVRPLYHEANVVVVPTLESAGTNVKVLEAMAMERAVVSTPSGVAGLGLEHGVNVWVADSPALFAQGLETLFGDAPLRARLASAGREKAVGTFGWQAIGQRQREMYRDLLGESMEIRRAMEQDLPEIARIQGASAEASQWEVASYLQVELKYEAWVAVIARGGKKQIVGFLVFRETAPGESEILNLAVDPAVRRRGVASRLLEEAFLRPGQEWFLEVRETNAGARKLYQEHGFHDVGRRENYYHNPPAAGIVMRKFS